MMRAGVAPGLATSLCLSLLALFACSPPVSQPVPHPSASSQASNHLDSTIQTPLTGDASSPVRAGLSSSAGSSTIPANSSNAVITEDNDIRDSLIAILKQKLPDLQENPAVSAIANEHARQLAVDTKATEFKTLQQIYTPVAPGALQTRLLQTGIFPTDNLVNAYLSDGSPEQVKTRFNRQMNGVIGPVPFSHYGIGVARKGNIWIVSTVLLTQILQIKNLPIVIPDTGTRTITGEVRLAGFNSPSILMTRPDGKVQSVPARITGNLFSSDLPLDQKGLYSFEVNVNGPLGPLPGTNFVLAVGVPYPSTASISVQSEQITNVAQARQTLLDLVNRDRQMMGAGVLQIDESLNLAAQAHSDDMVKNGFIGHNSPTMGTPQQQAFLFNVTDLISQNLAVSRTLINSERELMSSPGHRKTIIEPGHTHVGFGVTPNSDGFLYITQLFIQRRLRLEPLPKTVGLNQNFNVTGTAMRTGYAAAFSGEQVIGEPIEISQGQNFSLPVRLATSGKQRLRIGFAEPSNNGVFNFVFYNIWDLEVKP